ncbi:MAG: ABC transporter permease, partial [Phycisphaeraceae bacterium]
MRLPPAEAMRPEPPASFRATFVERLGMQRLLSPVARMVLRQLERRPVRAGLSVLGIAMAVGVLVLGRFTFDAVDYLMYAQFQLAQRQDVTVAFTDPVPGRALYELANLPGVTDVEGQRSVAARLRSGHREHLGGILGIDGRPRLQRVLDAREQEVAVPGEGLMLSETLAAKLAVAPGDVVTVEVLEDRRPVRRVELRSVVHDYAGTNAYMARDALNRLMREDRVVSSAHLRVDEAHLDAVYARLGRTPGVAGVQVRAATLQAFRDTIVESQATFRQFNLAFAVLIAFGVVYNTARVSLSERSRELATLRVLGFTRGEISRILLGELAVLTGLALPLGMVIGYGFAWVAAIAFETEMFRIPLVVRRETYAIAGLVVLLAATASGLVVRRRLDRLDLVGVLKARE